MQSLVTVLENLKAATKISDKTLILEGITNYEYKRVLNFLGDPNQVIGLSTKKIQKDVELVEHQLTLAELLDYLLVNNTGTDKEVGMVKHYLSQFDEHTKDVLAQVIGKSWTTTVGVSLLNKVYGIDFIPVFDVQLAFPYEKKINSYKDDDVFVVTQKFRDDSITNFKIWNIFMTNFSKNDPISAFTEDAPIN